MESKPVETIELKLEQVKTCPICKEWTYGELDKEETLVFPITYLGIQLYFVSCKECTGIFLINRMTDEQTEKYYQGTYRKITTPNDEMKDLDAWNEQQRAFHQFAFMKNKISLRSKVLDVGCSRGFLLQILREQFDLEVTGVDVGDKETMDLLGIENFGSLQDLGDRKFDLIILSHILEHQNHPDFFLNDVMKYGHNGTFYFIDVPNPHSDPAALLLHHPIGFTQTSMTRFLHNADLELRDFLRYDWTHTPLQRSIMYWTRKSPYWGGTDHYLS